MKKSKGLATTLIFFSLPIATRVAFADQVNFNNITGPSLYVDAGPPQVLNFTTASGTDVTVSGGVVLTNATNSPADETSAYSTISYFPGLPAANHYSNPLTISFSHKINDLALTVLNGLTSNATYRVTDNAGNTAQFTLPSNLQSGQRVVGFPTSGNLVTIQATSPLPQWNFAIDNIDFNYTPPGSPPERSGKQQALIHKGKTAMRVGGLALDVMGAVGGIICAASVACGVTVLGALAVATVAGATVDGVASTADFFDPVDLDFEKIAPPSPPSPPDLTADLPSNLLSPFSDLLQSSTQAIGYFNAAHTSFNRAEGAYYSRSPFYQKLQTNAVNNYLRDGELSVMSMGRDLVDLGNLLPNDGFPNISISASQVQAFESGLAANGFSSQQSSTLQSLGLSNQEMSQVLNDLTSQNPELLAGNYPEQLVNFGNGIISAEKTALPEPGSFWLMLTGLLMLFACRIVGPVERSRRRRRLVLQ